jgi:hypothetical protein
MSSVEHRGIDMRPTWSLGFAQQGPVNSAIARTLCLAATLWGTFGCATLERRDLRLSVGSVPSVQAREGQRLIQDTEFDGIPTKQRVEIAMGQNVIGWNLRAPGDSRHKLSLRVKQRGTLTIKFQNDATTQVPEAFISGVRILDESSRERGNLSEAKRLTGSTSGRGAEVLDPGEQVEFPLIEVYEGQELTVLISANSGANYVLPYKLIIIADPKTLDGIRTEREARERAAQASAEAQAEAQRRQADEARRTRERKLSPWSSDRFAISYGEATVRSPIIDYENGDPSDEADLPTIELKLTSKASSDVDSEWWGMLMNVGCKISDLTDDDHGYIAVNGGASLAAPALWRFYPYVGGGVELGVFGQTGYNGDDAGEYGILGVYVCGGVVVAIDEDVGLRFEYSLLGASHDLDSSVFWFGLQF